MAGFTINRFVCLGLRNSRLFPRSSQSSIFHSPSWNNTSSSMYQSVNMYFCRLSSNNSEEEEQQEVVKKDISMQQLNTISPTPFDTHTMVKQLQSSGFSENQAESLVRILVGVAQYSHQQALSGHVSHKSLDLLELKLKGEIDSVRSGQLILEKGTIAQISDKTQAAGAQTQKLKELLKEEVIKVQSGVELDINLERSRNKEQEAKTEQKIKDTYNRIDMEVALLKTTIESQKLEMIKYLAGGILTLVTLMVSVMMGIFRLWK